MACRIFYADFAGAIKSCTFGQIEVHAGGRGFYRFEIVNFNVEKCWSLANVGGYRWHILVRAGERLIHNLSAALLKNDECQPVAIGDFDRLDESEMLRPEGKHRFDFFRQKDRSEFVDVRELAPCKGQLVSFRLVARSTGVKERP
jgi:hypothetical protein